MARDKANTVSEEPSVTKRTKKALSPEARENQLINLAVNLAEEQLANGTASSQVITHFLKLGTEKTKLEREILEAQRDLYKAKTKALEDASDMKVLYENALAAMQRYSGTINALNNDDE